VTEETSGVTEPASPEAASVPLPIASVNESSYLLPSQVDIIMEGMYRAHYDIVLAVNADRPPPYILLGSNNVYVSFTFPEESGIRFVFAHDAQLTPNTTDPAELAQYVSCLVEPESGQNYDPAKEAVTFPFRLAPEIPWSASGPLSQRMSVTYATKAAREKVGLTV
jgi:hypothetical protein